MSKGIVQSFAILKRTDGAEKIGTKDGVLQDWLDTIQYARYSQTAAESAAGLTVTDYTAKPGDPVRYGAAADGSANDKALLKSIVDAGIVLRLGDNSRAYALDGILKLNTGSLVVSDGAIIMPWTSFTADAGQDNYNASTGQRKGLIGFYMYNELRGKLYIENPNEISNVVALVGGHQRGNTWLEPSYEVVIDDVEIKDVGWPAKIISDGESGCYRWDVRFLKAYTCSYPLTIATYGGGLAKTNALSFKHLLLLQSLNDALEIENAENNNIKFLNAEENTDWGVKIVSCQGFRISDSRFENNGGTGGEAIKNIRCDAGAKGVTIRGSLHNHRDSLQISTAAENIRIYDETEGEFTRNGKTESDCFLSREIDIEDDSFTTFKMQKITGFVAITAGNHFVQAYLNGGGSPVGTKLLGTGSFDVDTGSLTGTTGTDGNMTVTIDSAQNIYVENRTGATRKFLITVF